MANTFAPFGFRQWSGNGSSPTYEQVVMKIKSDYTTKIFFGDAVIQYTDGYIRQAADSTSTTQLAGVFQGCKYYSVSQKRTVWSNYWPGADNSGDIEAYVINDPNAKFIAQAAAAYNVTQAMVGSAATFTGSASGNTATGISAQAISAADVTDANSHPFRIVSLVTDPPGANGTDTASNSNYVIVAFNLITTRTNTGV